MQARPRAPARISPHQLRVAIPKFRALSRYHLLGHGASRRTLGMEDERTAS